MKNCVVMNHPLIVHKISLLKDKHTSSKDFKSIVKEISLLMGYELTKDLPLKTATIESPLGTVKTDMVAGKAVAFVPVLRGGLGMVDGLLALIPHAKVGHIGAYRDKDTKESVVYYSKLPSDIDEREVIVCDTLLATGGLASAAIQKVKDEGCTNIKFLTLLATAEGVKNVTDAHNDIVVYCASMVEGVDEFGKVPEGFGDIGERLFGTE